MFIHSPPLTYRTHVVCFLTDNNATVLAEDKQRVYESRSFILGNTVLGSKSQNTSPQHSSPQIKYIPSPDVYRY